MTGSEIVNRIREITLNPSPGRFTDAQILSMVNEGYTDFCRFTEMNHKSSTQVLPQYTALASIPDDYVDMRQVRLSYNRELYVRSERELDYQEMGWPTQVGSPETAVFYNYNMLRTKPIVSAASTITYRYCYIPTAITLTTEPNIPLVYHPALVDYASAQSFYIWRDYNNGALYWAKYVKDREQGKSEAQTKTPDTFTSQRPVTQFNYNRWDYGYRNR